MLNSLHKHNIIAEPVFFFVFFAIEIANFAIPNLYLQKACRNDTSFAPDLSTRCDDEKRGSDYLASVYNSFMLPGAIISLTFTLFASNYSDATKNRRVFIVAAIIGQQLKLLVSIAQALFWPWSPITGIILSCIVENAFGGFQSLFNFTYAHVFDRTSKENRLTRVTLLTMVESAGTLLGKGSAGFLMRRFGFLTTFVFSFVLYTLGLVSAFVFVREESVAAEYKVDLKYVFDVKRIWETFALIALPRQKPRKHVVAIWLLFLIDFIVYFSFFGERSIIYLYFRNHFHWDEEKFSLFSSYRNLSSAIGGILCSLVMSKWLKIHDAIFGALIAFWDMCGAVGFYFAREGWQIYSVLVFDIFRGLASSTCFTLISKFFTEREFGRVNCIAMIFLATGMSGVPVYSTLYTNTSDTHPNAIFMLSAFLNILFCVLYSITYFLCPDTTQPSDQKTEAPTMECENHAFQ